MLRVYVASPLSAKDVDYIENVRQNGLWACRVWEMGFSPFFPGSDFLLGLLADFGPTVEQYKQVSMDWLEVADIVLAPGRISAGVGAEITRAKELNNPVVYSFENLLAVREAMLEELANQK